MRPRRPEAHGRRRAEAPPPPTRSEVDRPARREAARGELDAADVVHAQRAELVAEVGEGHQLAVLDGVRLELAILDRARRTLELHEHPALLSASLADQLLEMAHVSVLAVRVSG